MYLSLHVSLHFLSLLSNSLVSLFSNSLSLPASLLLLPILFLPVYLLPLSSLTLRYLLHGFHLPPLSLYLTGLSSFSLFIPCLSPSLPFLFPLSSFLFVHFSIFLSFSLSLSLVSFFSLFSFLTKLHNNKTSRTITTHYRLVKLVIACLNVIS